MHVLDRNINDLELRIKDIYNYNPKEENTSLQTSLSAYGWILLDAWVAWRSLRFLLKDTYIDDYVLDKWFQTPSSYTAAQIKAVWKFDDSAEKYIEDRTNKGLKSLFDGTIQANRNAAAHFTKKVEIKGSDRQNIKQFFEALSTVFLFYETKAFFVRVTEKLSKNGFESFKINFIENDIEFNMEDIASSIKEYDKCEKFLIIGQKISGEIICIYVEEEGCFVSHNRKIEKNSMNPVIDSEHSKYYFWGNKGFYRDVDMFVNSVISCLNTNQ